MDLDFSSIDIEDSSYEPDIFRVINFFVKPGWVCADVGAHQGMIVALLAEIVGPTGKVIAFEAHPQNVDLLRQNIASRGLSPRVEIENIAVTDGSESEVWLYPGKLYSSFEWNIVGHDVSGNPTEPLMKVKASSLDDYFPSGSRIDFMKIDIEGAATLAFPGMLRLLKESQPILMIEFHDQEEWEERGTLYEAGYDLWNMEGKRLDREKDTERVYHGVAVPKSFFSPEV